MNGPLLANYWGGPGPLGPPMINAPAANQLKLRSLYCRPVGLNIMWYKCCILSDNVAAVSPPGDRQYIVKYWYLPVLRNVKNRSYIPSTSGFGSTSEINRSASLLIKKGCFPQILDLFQGLKIGVSSGCLGENSILK